MSQTLSGEKTDSQCGRDVCGDMRGGNRVPILPGRGRTLMAGSILSAADIWVNWSRSMSWSALGIQSVSTLLNWITPSRSERLLWGAVTSAILVMALLVMFT